jgi:decaprenylphospho-beta-D-erythro-pentofuranosid-2-ulose 2-reductase
VTSTTRNVVLVIGASSVLARALANEYASSKWRVVFAGRDEKEMSRVASDVMIRKRADVKTIRLDLSSSASIDEAAGAICRDGIPNVLIFVAGVSDGAAEAPYDARLAEQILSVNYSGPCRLVGALLPDVKNAPGTMLAFVSSIAGERGRRTNFVYGAAKAALNTYCQGLRALLLPNGVGVLTIKLGYMDTRLAYGVAPAAMTCSPRYAARSIHQAIERRRMVVYVPAFWRWISIILRAIPERIFLRLPIP